MVLVGLVLATLRASRQKIPSFELHSKHDDKSSFAIAVQWLEIYYHL